MIYYEVFESTYFLFLLTINKAGEFIYRLDKVQTYFPKKQFIIL